MKLSISSLSTEEHQVLSYSKKNWQKSEERYSDFFFILGKYIEHYQTSPQIDLSFISFPEITFNHELLGSASIFINDATFYGDTVFENLVFEEKVHISGGSFLGKCHFENIIFHKDANIMHNTFEQEVTLKELTFKEEAFFADNVYHGTLLLDTLTFSKEASFSDSLLSLKCVIKDINGIEWFDWDDLYCVNYEQCEWDALDEYIARKEQNEIRLINLVKEIKQEFPEVIDEIKEELYQSSLGWSCYFWIEKFGYLTRDLLRRREYGQAQKYLNFMDKALKTDDPNMKNTIETGYVENILYDLAQKQQKEAWKYIPERTKRSYAALWSVPT